MKASASALASVFCMYVCLFVCVVYEALHSINLKSKVTY